MISHSSSVTSSLLMLTSVPSTIVAQWIFKSLYEAAATPLTYLVVNHLKRTEGVDVYDRDVSLNPLPISK
jgi:queuosine precursor transporter